jgi:flagellar basal body-associated protein FliL
MAQEQIDANVNQPAKAKKSLLPYVIVLVLMLAEGAGIFFVMRSMGSKPTAAAAAGAPEHGESGGEKKEGEGGKKEAGTEGGKGEATLDAEVPICQIDGFNRTSGRQMMVRIEVVGIVAKEKEENLKKLVELRKATIGDRITTIIRAAEPRFLSEPGLETMRRQIKFELDKVFGDDKLINEILIPKLLQSAMGN